MSKTRTNNFTRPLFSLIICLILIFTAFTVTASANEINESELEITYREFFMSDDEGYIYDSEGKYTQYTLPVGYHLCDNTAYVYATPIDVLDPYGDVYVYTPYVGSDLYWLDGLYYYDIIYLSDIARDELSKFIDGEYFSLALSDDYSRLAPMNDSDLSSIKSPTDTRAVDVRELASLDKYEIYAYDKTGAIYQVIGAVYITANDEYLYIDYTALPNNYFDAYGYFSYRDGEVNAKILDVASISTLNDLIDKLDYPDYYYTYEDDGEDDFGNILLVLFWILLVTIGIALPLIIIALTIFLPSFLEKRRIRKLMAFVRATEGENQAPAVQPEPSATAKPDSPRAKRPFTPWTLATILSATWLALGIALLLILIL